MTEDARRKPAWSFAESAGWIWGNVTVGSGLIALLTSRRAPSFFEAMISRGTTLAVALLAMHAVLGFVFREDVESAWSRILRLLPVAVLAALGLAAVGPWNDGSGAMALPMSGALQFIGSVGVFPLSVGPDVFLRSAVAAVAIGLGIGSFRRIRRIGRAIAVAVLAWTAGSVTLLVSSWTAILSGWASGTRITHTQDALRALGYLHSNSYWSFFQSDRFFAGIGRQLETGAMLSTAAITFLLGVALLLPWLRRARPWNRPGILLAAIREAWVRPVAGAFLLALFSGAWLGVRTVGWSWGALDAVALFLLAATAGAWLWHWTLSRDVASLRDDEARRPWRLLPSGQVQVKDVTSLSDALRLLALLGAFLLGWPLLLMLLALFAVSSMNDRMNVRWRNIDLFRAAEPPILAALLVGAGSVFGTRQLLFPPGAAVAALAAALLAAAIPLIKVRKRPEQ
ncbi:hypothetical protein HY479_03395 [Candidatus Uhrbacteria bacterium]|nr:hypothetical protein [Candidatus Uhrbacteria bacterium]